MNMMISSAFHEVCFPLMNMMISSRGVFTSYEHDDIIRGVFTSYEHDDIISISRGVFSSYEHDDIITRCVYLL